MARVIEESTGERNHLVRITIKLAVVRRDLDLIGVVDRRRSIETPSGQLVSG